jgi:hypothetical protein
MAGSDFIQYGTSLKRLRKHLNKMYSKIPSQTAAHGAESSNDNGRSSFAVHQNEPFFIKLTSKTGSTPIKYGWTFQNHDRTTDAWSDGVVTGDTTANWAEELNNADLSVTDNKRYRARLNPQSGRLIFESGGGGAMTATSNSIIMILGTFNDYKNCPGVLGVAGEPPKDSSNNLCVPAYAWAEYAVCGYHMKKLRDMRSFPYWATGLNGQSAPANRRFYNAYFGDPTGNCQGVRFLEYSAAGGVTCSCPSWLNSVSCFKLTAKFVSTLTDVAGDSCPAQFYADMAPYWGQTVSATVCNQTGCLWSGTLGPFDISAYWREIPTTDPRCFWGPDDFDPCNPCDSFGDMVVSVNKGYGSGGNIANSYTGFYTILSALKALVNNCASGPLTLDFGPKASPCPQVFEWLKIDCCSSTEANNCTGTTPP